MNTYDPISDMLIRARSAQRANKATVAMSSSKLKCATARVLKDEGYVEGFTVSADAKSVLKVQSKYYAGRPMIERIKRASHPGLRIYKASNKIPSVANNLGVTIVSISKSAMTDRKTRSESVGDESLCIVV